MMEYNSHIHIFDKIITQDSNQSESYIIDIMNFRYDYLESKLISNFYGINTTISVYIKF